MKHSTQSTRRVVAGIVSCGFFWLVPAAVRGDDLYAIRLASTSSIGTDLISINPTTGEGTLVGTVRLLAFPYGLSDRRSDLYTFYPDDPNYEDNLVRIDPSNGNMLAGFELNIPGAQDGSFVALREGGIAFRNDGVGFLANNGDSDSDLWRFTVGATNATLISSTLVPLMDGLDFNGAGELFGISQPQTGAPYQVYTINQTTGQATLVGNTGIANASQLPAAGLTFASDGTVYAVLNDKLYTLDPNSNYSAVLVGDVGFDRISGLTALVPEPASILLAGLGCLALLKYRRSRQGSIIPNGRVDTTMRGGN